MTAYRLLVAGALAGLSVLFGAVSATGTPTSSQTSATATAPPATDQPPAARKPVADPMVCKELAPPPAPALAAGGSV